MFILYFSDYTTPKCIRPFDFHILLKKHITHSITVTLITRHEKIAF